MKKSDIIKIEKFSKALRKNIIDMAFYAGASSAHLGGALSIVEIISTLFCHVMKYNNDLCYLSIFVVFCSAVATIFDS